MREDDPILEGTLISAEDAATLVSALEDKKDEPCSVYGTKLLPKDAYLYAHQENVLVLGVRAYESVEALLDD